MAALFVALGIAVLTLLALLLWFVPHLLQQQALRSAGESAHLREMLLDVLNEQEAVTLRQTQLGTSMSRLQDQLEQMVVVTGSQPGGASITNAADLRKIEERLGAVQQQFQSWLDQRNGAFRQRAEQDNEAWGRLNELLAVIQQRVGTLSDQRANNAVGVHASSLLEELEQEMGNLRSISEDIARLQWRLRRSLSEREANTPLVRQTSSRAHQHA
jgi:hypothetical protein